MLRRFVNATRRGVVDVVDVMSHHHQSMPTTMAVMRFYAARTATQSATTIGHEPLSQRLAALDEARRRPPNAGMPGYNEKGHKLLTVEDIAEIKRLRAEDPAKWTQISLARRFECSRLQVAIHAPAPERQKQHEFVQHIYAERRLRRDPELRTAMRDAYVARVTAAEHAAWQAKLERKRLNALAAAANKAAVDAGKAAWLKARMDSAADAARDRYRERDRTNAKRAAAAATEQPATSAAPAPITPGKTNAARAAAAGGKSAKPQSAASKAADAKAEKTRQQEKKADRVLKNKAKRADRDREIDDPDY